MRNIFIVEGGNYCGKTMITGLLKSILTNATVIEMHDFYFLHILKEKNIDNLNDFFSKQAYENLNELDIINAEKYLNKRNDSIIRFIEDTIYEDIIIERFFLTQMVYKDYLFNQMNQDYFDKIEKTMSAFGAKLILTSATDIEIINRINRENREIRLGKKVQYHVIEEEAILKKNKLYNFHFDRLKYIDKFKIEVNDRTHDFKEITNTLREIING